MVHRRRAFVAASLAVLMVVVWALRASDEVGPIDPEARFGVANAARVGAPPARTEAGPGPEDRVVVSAVEPIGPRGAPSEDARQIDRDWVGVRVHLPYPAVGFASATLVPENGPTARVSAPMQGEVVLEIVASPATGGAGQLLGLRITDAESLLLSDDLVVDLETARFVDVHPWTGLGQIDVSIAGYDGNVVDPNWIDCHRIDEHGAESVPLGVRRIGPAQFHIAHVPTGTYVVSVRAIDPSYSFDAPEVRVLTGRTAHVEVRAERHARLVVQMPAEGRVVVENLDSGSVATASRAEFEAWLPPGRYRATHSVEGRDSVQDFLLDEAGATLHFR